MLPRVSPGGIAGIALAGHENAGFVKAGIPPSRFFGDLATAAGFRHILRSDCPSKASHIEHIVIFRRGIIVASLTLCDSRLAGSRMRLREGGGCSRSLNQPNDLRRHKGSLEQIA